MTSCTHFPSHTCAHTHLRTHTHRVHQEELQVWTARPRGCHRRAWPIYRTLSDTFAMLIEVRLRAQGGNEGDGSKLYVARVHLEDGSIHPGAPGSFRPYFALVAALTLSRCIQQASSASRPAEVLSSATVAARSTLVGPRRLRRHHRRVRPRRFADLFSIMLGSYDLLCGDANSVKWHDFDGPLTSVEGLNPVEGGQVRCRQRQPDLICPDRLPSAWTDRRRHQALCGPHRRRAECPKR